MHILEENVRLKDSCLWKLQEAVYSEFGPSAWAKKGVPFYLTQNPLIAKQFSYLILSYLQEAIKKKTDEPVYIFDLGAGSGKLGYLILKHLIPLVENHFGKSLKLCYVMTVVVKSNIDFWQNHPMLKEYVKKGYLDFAEYHQAEKKKIKLINSGKVLDQKTIKNPIVVICTYFFDTVYQDFFSVKDGKLNEGRITLNLPDDMEKKGETGPNLISKLEASYDFVPIKNVADYYPKNPELNKLLQSYCKMKENFSFLFPLGAFETLNFFAKISNNRMLLLAGDQGIATKKQLIEDFEIKICKHASFSMPVNYDSIASYFQNLGGSAILPEYPDIKFIVMAGLLGGKFPRTHLTYQKTLDYFSPIEYWRLTNINDEIQQKMSINQLLDLVKLGNFDPINFYFFISAILQKLSGSTKDEREKLSETIDKVWDNFYLVDSIEAVFVNNLAMAHNAMKNNDRTRFFLKKAEEIATAKKLSEINFDNKG